MQIEQNISLRPYNTFGIDATARYFTKFRTPAELKEIFDLALTDKKDGPLILGGGSNILLTGNHYGFVAINELRGIEVVQQDEQHVYVQAAAGENWHHFVMYCIQNDLAGVENLSLIPGSVGASPMQNIGAYGVEIKDVFYQLEAFHRTKKRFETFDHTACQFDYRESVFKRKYKGQYVITSVTFRLNKKPEYNTSYGAIQQELDKMNVQQLSIKAIAEAVIHIRQSKLPNPAEIGNAGSFFKNPTVSTKHFNSLQASFPDIVGFPSTEGMVKVAAGWLIEQCGWKGYRIGDAGCHAKQALVLVNYGGASGHEIYDLSTQIVESVDQRFGILLEREVNVL